MRVVFMGTPDFAVPTLDAIVEAGHEVVLVVAQPDRKSGRGQRTTAPPVARRAKELGLPLSQPRAIRTGSFPNRLEALDADVAVVLAYGRILTERLLTAPRLGCINVHASLLRVGGGLHRFKPPYSPEIPKPACVRNRWKRDWIQAALSSTRNRYCATGNGWNPTR